MTPGVASLGAQFTATVSGQNLGGALSAGFSGSGIVSTIQPGSDSNTLKLGITVGDAPIGTRSLTVVTPTGIVTLPNALLIQTASIPTTKPLAIPEVETGPIQSGYVIITPDAGSSPPLAVLTYGMVSGGVVQSQAAILPTSLTMDSTLQLDVLPGIGRNVGMAIANASGTAATITLTIRNEDGVPIGSATSFSIPAGQQVSRFVTELLPPATLGAAFRGSVNVQSSESVSLIGLRFSGIVFSTLPIVAGNPSFVPIRQVPSGTVGGNFAVMFSQFAMSGGWATTLGLTNSTSGTISGRIDIFDTSGNPMPVKLNGATQSTFNYSIRAKGAFTLAPRDVNGQSPF
jgi:hypothetical protein